MGAQILIAVENPTRREEPPQAAWTLERLLVQGIQREEALKYIACALSVEIIEGIGDMAVPTTSQGICAIWLACLKLSGAKMSTRDLTSRSSRRR